MSKKRALIFLCLAAIISILAINSFVYAAENATNTTTTATINKTGFDLADKCLRDQIDAKTYSSLTTEELAFSLLALGYDKTRQDAIKTELQNRKSTTDNCWPNTGCTLKETAEVLLAFTYINADISGIKNWLMNQTIAASDLVWYLQVETNNKSQCTITYDNSSRKITVEESKLITGNAGTCLRSAQNGYWLEVDSRCYDKNFDISCDNDFITSTFYKRKTGTTYYITASTQTSGPNGKLTEKVESLCFKQGANCNYEGSLWATFAINKKDTSVKNSILPYLLALSSDTSNTKYLPSSFLYSITNFDEYLTELTNQQNTKGYWQVSETSRRYYDTALALLAFSGSSGSTQSDAAIQYLLEPSIQGTDGCWNGDNVRDTAFVLYAASPKNAATGTGLAPISQCSDYTSQGYSCISSTECDNINGTSLPNFNCYAGMICCSKSVAKKTCSEQSGTICSSDQQCSTDLISASGTTSCCPADGKCNLRAASASECETAGYACKLSCSTGEEKQTLGCNENLDCCMTSVAPAKSYWWLWLLIILIILIALAIIFRNQLKIWWFRIKSKFSKGPVPSQARPPYPPAGPGQRPGMIRPGMMRPGMMPPPGMPRRIIPGMQPRPLPPGARPIGRPFAKEKELDETLRKLKEMSR